MPSAFLLHSREGRIHHEKITALRSQTLGDRGRDCLRFVSPRARAPADWSLRLGPVEPRARHRRTCDSVLPDDLLPGPAHELRWDPEPDQVSRPRDTLQDCELLMQNVAGGTAGHVSAAGETTNLRRARRRIPETALQDRKSTRLNSSHLVISYAVFCLKKKKKNRENAGYLGVPHHHDKVITHDNILG